MADTPALTRADCPLDHPVRIARIADQNPAFLQFVERSGLKPGISATVTSRDAHADAVTIHPTETPPVTLGTAAAAKIFVEPRDGDRPPPHVSSRRALESHQTE
jgi:hypothetical protein